MTIESAKWFQSIYNPVQPRVIQAEESWLKKYQIHNTIVLRFLCRDIFVWYQDQEECHIPTFELMLTFDFSEQNAHTIWQEYGDRDRYVNWILQTQKVQMYSTVCLLVVSKIKEFILNISFVMLIFLLERSLFDGIDLLEIDHLSISGDLFSTEGALRRPLTYDNHPSIAFYPIPSQTIVFDDLWSLIYRP